MPWLVGVGALVDGLVAEILQPQLQVTARRTVGGEHLVAALELLQQGDRLGRRLRGAQRRALVAAQADVGPPLRRGHEHEEMDVHVPRELGEMDLVTVAQRGESEHEQRRRDALRRQGAQPREARRRIDGGRGGLEVGEQLREPAMLVGRGGGVGHPGRGIVRPVVEQALEDGGDLAREGELARGDRAVAVAEVATDPLEGRVGEPCADGADDPPVQRPTGPVTVGGEGFRIAGRRTGGLVDRLDGAPEGLAREEEVDRGDAALEGGELVAQPALHAAAADDDRDRRHGVGGPVGRERRGQAPDQPLGLGVAVRP